MNIRFFRSLLAAFLAMLLLHGSVHAPFPVSADEVAVTESTEVEPTEGVEATELPEDAIVPIELGWNDAYHEKIDAVAQNIDATQILVFDATNNEVLYTKTSDNGKLYPASITKLFTAYVALQYLEPDDAVVAGDELSFVQPGSSMAYIYRGQCLAVKTVIQGMLLPSGNDAAYVLAAAAGRAIAGDESLSPEEAIQEFVREMNRQAEALGFENSHFANPDGYHVGAHYTCVNDIARIAQLALENSRISRYMSYHEIEVTYYSGQVNTWTNTNLLLDPESGYYTSAAIGMKTGKTSQAGNCLLAAYKVGDRVIVVGVFGGTDQFTRFSNATKLMKACIE